MGRVSAQGRKLPLRYAGREASASPATGFHKTHEFEQKLLIDEALSEGSTMAVELTVPQLGESITEAVVGKWHKKVGDAVAVDEPVVVLETDKVTIDVPAPAAGALDAHRPQGGRQGEDRRRAGHHRGRGAAPRRASPPPSDRAGRRRPRPPRLPPRRRRPSTRATSHPRGARDRRRERGIDPAHVQGSGSHGRVMKDDVLHRWTRQPAAPQAPPPRRSGAGAQPRPRQAAREERVKMTPLRKRVAERLLQAQNNAAILTTFNEVDMGEVMALRKQYDEKFQAKHGVKLGLHELLRAARPWRRSRPSRRSTRRSTATRSSSSTTTTSAWRCPAAAGLVVPVVRDADQLSMAELEKTIADSAARARNDKLTLADLQGGTFTITNGGIFGSMLSTPILNPPQTGILGMHNIVDRPVVRDGQVVVRPMMYLALSTTTGWSTAARRCSSWCASRSASRTPSGCCSRSDAHLAAHGDSGSSDNLGRADWTSESARSTTNSVRLPVVGQNGRPSAGCPCKRRKRNGNWYREVVQRREGLRLHHPGRRRRGRVLPPHRHPDGWFRTLAEGQKVEFDVTRAPRACRRRTSARREASVSAIPHGRPTRPGPCQGPGPCLFSGARPLPRALVAEDSRARTGAP